MGDTQCDRDILRGQKTQSGSGAERCSHEVVQSGHGVELQRVGMEWGRDGVGWGRERGWDGDWGGMRTRVEWGRGWDVDAAWNGDGKGREWGGMRHGMETGQGSIGTGMGWQSIILALYNLRTTPKLEKTHKDQLLAQHTYGMGWHRCGTAQHSMGTCMGQCSMGMGWHSMDMGME